MKWLCMALLMLAPLGARAAFLDCMFFDTFDGEAASAPSAWQGNLAVHNCARKTVEPAASPPIPLLRWAGDLATTAQTYANQCIWAHSGTPGLGENLYAAAPPNSVETDAAQSWAGEFSQYNYSANTCGGDGVCGHYTQMVWRTTTEVGCGMTDCSTGSPFKGFPNWTIVVCNYRPPGNDGSRPY